MKVFFWFFVFFSHSHLCKTNLSTITFLLSLSSLRPFDHVEDLRKDEREEALTLPQSAISH